MSALPSACPDAAAWRALAAHRAEPLGEEPPGWGEALAHLDGCSRCRRAALAADPTLVFHRLPGLPAQETARDAVEVEAVRRAVAAMRTLASADGRKPRPSRLASVRRWATAAALAAATLGLGSSPELGTGGAGDERAAVEMFGTPAALAQGASRIPAVEELNRPEARVYQMDGPGLSVVMIVSEKFEGLGV